MRIAQIVTYVSKEGSFGGPVAVAVAQAQELASRGFEVELIAGWDGKARLFARGVEVRLFRARRVLPAGFSGLVSLGVIAYILKNARSFDLVHIHLARDLVTLPTALILSLMPKVKLVVQSHGMIVPDSRLKARIADTIAVRRVLRMATSVIAYPGVDDSALRAVSQNAANIVHLPNGVASADMDRLPPRRDNEVLFMARLHPRKRVMRFAEMARNLLQAGTEAVFCVVGPDEGDLSELKSFINHHSLHGKLSYEGAVPLERVRERLSQATVYVLPSHNEPFPMTVLEALAVGTPTVIVDTCGIAVELGRMSAAVISDGTPANLARCVAELLEDPNKRLEYSYRGKEAIKEHYGIKSVIDALLRYYR